MVLEWVSAVKPSLKKLNYIRMVIYIFGNKGMVGSTQSTQTYNLESHYT